MRASLFVGKVLITVIAIAAASAIAQQDEGPVLMPKPKAKPAGATLLVMCDLACNWNLDGEAKGHIDAGGSAKAKVELGQHVVVATTEDGIDQLTQLSEVGSSGQTVVSIELTPLRVARLERGQSEPRDHASGPAKQGKAFYDLGRYTDAKPLLQRACDGGDMNSCGLLGSLQGPDAQGLAHARGLLQKACDGGSSSACEDLGWMYDSGRGGPKDDEQARILYKKGRDGYEKGCDGGESDACVGLAWLYQFGRGGPKDAAQARALYQRGCDAGSESGCTSLALMYASGEGGSRDVSQARALFQRSQKLCDGGDMTSCSAFGFFCENGMGGTGTPDLAQARKFYEKACNGGNMNGCFRLGVLYQYGNGVSRDFAQARVYYTKACEQGMQTACVWLRGLP